MALYCGCPLQCPLNTSLYIYAGRTATSHLATRIFNEQVGSTARDGRGKSAAAKKKFCMQAPACQPKRRRRLAATAAAEGVYAMIRLETPGQRNVLLIQCAIILALETLTLFIY